MFTRQHYKAIAEILQSERSFAIDIEGHCYNCKERIRHIIVEMADYFATDNSRFDRQKFLAACGLE